MTNAIRPNALEQIFGGVTGVASGLFSGIGCFTLINAATTHIPAASVNELTVGIAAAVVGASSAALTHRISARGAMELGIFRGNGDTETTASESTVSGPESTM